MMRRPTSTTPTDTLIPYTTLFRPLGRRECEDGAERLAIATVEAPPIVAVGGKAVALEYLPRDAKPEDIVDKRTANGKFHIAATMFADLEVDEPFELVARSGRDRKRTRLNSSH